MSPNPVGRPAGRGQTPEAQHIQAARRTRLQRLIDTRFDKKKSAFAEAVGINPTAVSHYLNKRTITDEFCLTVAKMLNISAAWMLRGEGAIDDVPAPIKPNTNHEGSSLKKYRESRGLSKAALGRLLGLAAGSASISVAQYEESAQLERKTKIKLASALQMSEAELQAILGGFSHVVTPVEDDELVSVPFLPVRARAGFAETFLSDEHESVQYDMVTIRRDAIRVGFETEKARKNKMYVAEVDGDSMEPLLHPGYWVTVYLIDPGDWDYATGVVAVLYRDRFVIKRIIENRLPETGSVTLHSDNPKGGSNSVPRSEIRAIFRVDEIVGGKIK
ncbi:LexA family transcriptional regulator [Fibrella aestuarina]|nr:S24 family peptidase [Fibrella aestuarina]